MASVLRFADLELDEVRHEVRRGEHVDRAVADRVRVAAVSVANSGRVVSKAQILDHVWRYDFRGDESIVESYISFLRKKIDGFDPPLIHTVRGVGYTPSRDSRRYTRGKPMKRALRGLRVHPWLTTLVAVVLIARRRGRAPISGTRSDKAGAVTTTSAQTVSTGTIRQSVVGDRHAGARARGEPELLRVRAGHHGRRHRRAEGQEGADARDDRLGRACRPAVAQAQASVASRPGAGRRRREQQRE